MKSRRIEAERARCRRPITADEVTGLKTLGDELRRLRSNVAPSEPKSAVRPENSPAQGDLEPPTP